MPRFYFDCLSNGVLSPDEFGMDLLDDDIADQAQAILIDIMTDYLPNNYPLMAIVNVRSEDGKIIYSAYGGAGGYPVEMF